MPTLIIGFAGVVIRLSLKWVFEVHSTSSHGACMESVSVGSVLVGSGVELRLLLGSFWIDYYWWLLPDA